MHAWRGQCRVFGQIACELSGILTIEHVVNDYIVSIDEDLNILCSPILYCS